MTSLPRTVTGSVPFDLQRRIADIYDHLYANAPMRTPAGISREVGKLLRTGMFAEERGRTVLRSPSLFRLGTATRPAFDFTKAELNALDRGDRRLQHQVASEVRQLFSEMSSPLGDYHDPCAIALADSDIAHCCAQLSGILISDPARDIIGDTLEVIRSQWAKRLGGQFFTDPRVTSLAVSLLEFNPIKGDDLVDISSGTGGFLLAGINRIRSLLHDHRDETLTDQDLATIAARSIVGQEIDAEVCEIANITISSRLGGASMRIVYNRDSLDYRAFTGPNHGPLSFDSHLCAATNPPFGTKITIKEREVLSHFELSKSPDARRSNSAGSRDVSPRPPDILLLEQNVRLLKPGEGRLAIVLPYQILSGPQTLYVRDWLLRSTRLIAVIDLPPETFQPHTGTKTSLVVARRRSAPLGDVSDDQDGDVFMSIPRWIGHDRRGNPVYRRDDDGVLTDNILTDFDQLSEAARAYHRGEAPSDYHGLSFTVPYKHILRDRQLRINAAFHQPSQNSKRSALAKSSTPRVQWKRVRLGDVVDRVFYPTRFKRNYVDFTPGAVPFLGGANISQLVPITDKWLRPDDKLLQSLRVSPGWILVTRSGSTGVVSSVPEEWDGYAISEHVIRIVPDRGKLAPEYLHAYLRSEHGQRQLARGVYGSVIDEITPEHIEQMEIPLPTSQSILGEIVEQMKEAETSRQKAIRNYQDAMGYLNHWL